VSPPGPPTAFVVHWSEEELPAKVAAVEAAGFAVVGREWSDGARAGTYVKGLEPDVLVVWLARLPSHGRVTAQAIRASGWGRALPIVFVDGDPEPLDAARMAKVREAVPDAFVCSPGRLRTALGAALAWGEQARAERQARLASRTR
jgi:hypothetical protein